MPRSVGVTTTTTKITVSPFPPSKRSDDDHPVTSPLSLQTYRFPTNTIGSPAPTLTHSVHAPVPLGPVGTRTAKSRVGIDVVGNILSSLGIDGDDEMNSVGGGWGDDGSVTWSRRPSISRLSTASPIRRSMSALPIITTHTQPTPSVVYDQQDDAIFKSDLAHMLVWFVEDLTESQKLTTTLALLRKLRGDQIGMLVECLKEEGIYQDEADQSRTTNIHSSSQSSPSFSPRKSPSLSSTTTSSTTSNTDINPNSPLFRQNLTAWLRLHRLHKYTDMMKVYSPRDLLQMNEVELERIGIVALGARRKFLRLFTAIKEEQGQYH